MELTYHDGTVRDLVFMQDTSNHSSLLISGGAGDCKLYVTDCETGTPIRIQTGHSGELGSTFLLLYPPYPKDRGMLWFYVEAARRPQWC